MADAHRHGSAGRADVVFHQGQVRGEVADIAGARPVNAVALGGVVVLKAHFLTVVHIQVRRHRCRVLSAIAGEVGPAYVPGAILFVWIHQLDAERPGGRAVCIPVLYNAGNVPFEVLVDGGIVY